MEPLHRDTNEELPDGQQTDPKPCMALRISQAPCVLLDQGHLGESYKTRVEVSVAIWFILPLFIPSA